MAETALSSPYLGDSFFEVSAFEKACTLTARPESEAALCMTIRALAPTDARCFSLSACARATRCLTYQAAQRASAARGHLRLPRQTLLAAEESR